MRDWPMRVICCNSLTDNSSRSKSAMMRRRVESAKERRDFRTLDIADTKQKAESRKQKWTLNPKGIPRQSPGLRGTSYPGGTRKMNTTLKGLRPEDGRALLRLIFQKFQLTPCKRYISSNPDTSI